MGSPITITDRNISRIINEYVSVSNERKDLEKREKELKEILVSLDKDKVSSAKYTISISTFIRKTLNRKSIEKEMGEDWIAQHQNESVATRLNVRAN